MAVHNNQVASRFFPRSQNFPVRCPILASRAHGVNVRVDRPIPLPAGLKALAQAPSLLSGERPEEYESLRHANVAEIAPQSGVEWLWTIDLIELSWNIHRYRVLRHKLLENCRQQAIKETLRRIDPVGIPRAFYEIAGRYIEENASRWQTEPDEAIQIENRLSSHGIDARSIDMEAIIQAKDLFFMFDSLLNSAQNRRAYLLREIEVRRAIPEKEQRFQV